MSDLATLLNKRREKVSIMVDKGREKVSIMGEPFDVREGPIPLVVPVFQENGRTFAGGKKVLSERLAALRSKDAEQIEAWGNNYYDLADACITFEDLLKAQPESPLLKGIMGVVETSDGLYVAINAEAVSKATKGDMIYFTIWESANVTYGVGDNKVSKKVSNVVLFKYAKPDYIELTGDQFNSVDAQALKRSDFVHGRDMEKKEIVSDKTVIHPVYKTLWPAELVAPLVSETFKFNGREHGYDTNMGLYLAGEPQNDAEMRAFCVFGLDGVSRLFGGGIGSGILRLVGVVDNSAAGAAKK